ncbi:MAG: T9SS type A sorting domain-containing protein [Ignavibacteriales bacterium]|nr:T9SS type A sorting domain-containing protein [Ignavibacteriales bacterium]
MKTIYKILYRVSLSFLLVSSLFSQGFEVSWKWNAPNGNKLNDVFLYSSSYALAVGDCGTVWKTTNGGTGWSLMEVPWTDDCLKVWFTDANTIFIVTKDSNYNYCKVRRSTDNGVSWIARSLASTSTGNNVAMFSGEYGFMLSGSYVSRTPNFFSSYTNYPVTYVFSEITLADSLNIFAYGYTTYLSRSSSGGISWTTINCGKSLTELTMIDTTGYAINKSNKKELLKTTDRGSSFSVAYTFAGTLQKLAFAGKDTGFALVTDGFENNTIYKTTNGGTTWLHLRSDLHLFSLHNYQKKSIIAVGSGGRIISSSNSGSNWRSSSKLGYDFNCITFPTYYTGFIGGNDGAFYKITEGGDYYSKLNLSTTRDINGMVFFDSLTGFIAGEKGMIKSTTNGGTSFVDYQLSDTTSNVVALDYVIYYDSWYGNVLKLFYCNSNGEVFISSDTCRTWTQLTIPDNDFIVDCDGIYFGSNNGNVYRYDVYSSAILVSLSGVLTNKVKVGYKASAYYTGDNEGYAVDYTGKTAAKEVGNPWQIGDEVQYGSQDFVIVYGRNFITGSTGSIFSAIDGYTPGIKNWEKISTPTHATIRSLAPRASNEYWAVGDDGVVLKIIANPSSSFQVSFDTAFTVAGDTAVMDVNLEYLSGSVSSLQFSINTSSDMSLVGVDTAGTLMGAKKWSCFTNGATQQAKFAAGGANDINSTGTLVRLKFRVNTGVSPKDIQTTVSALTINNGTHSPTILRHGIVKVVRYGDVDVNGTVQAYDASLILKYLVNYITLTGAQKKIGDVTKDGTLSDVDASLIFRYVVGLIDSLPAPGTYLASGSISMNDHNANAGQIINIPVTMNGVTGLMGFEGSITFDHQKLEFIGASATGIASGFTIEHKVTSGKILVAAASQQDAAGSGESVILQFRVKENAVIGTTQVKITRIRLNENAEQFDVAESNINILTGIKGEGSIPKEYELSQNYPNPFNPETRITFGIPEASIVTLEIFNSLGEKMTTLFSEERSAGYYNVNWNGMTFPTGIYIVRMTATSTESRKSFSQIKKMVLIK